jgi:hypothetical protein
MKKIAALLSLTFVLFTTGTANALANEYYEGFQGLSEPTTMLILGLGLIWTAGVARRF